MTPMTQPLVMNDVICDVIGNTPLTHSYSYTVGLGLTRGALHASLCARAARSMTSSLHVTNDVIPISTMLTHLLPRQLMSYLFLHHYIVMSRIIII